jgi:hypothetical protein
MDSVIGSKEDNLQKLMVIMNPSSVEDDSVTSFDVECLTFIASTETIVSHVHNLRIMCVQYEEQKQAFIALRLVLLRRLMEHYLTYNSPDAFLGSKY